jgi:hypothetical protein
MNSIGHLLGKALARDCEFEFTEEAKTSSLFYYA